ncbi:hypothetical protein [Nocardioides panacisoli]|uniref:Uncharacterized protein n=1 Tax=Nocardioides panacisoli TaxID=627624 RepID=A0ABP7I8A9_9ACTN
MRRTTAALTLALALLVIVDAAASAPLQRWEVVVVPVAVLGAVVAAVRVWTVDCFCGRVTAALLGAAVLAAQVLTSGLGLPARTPSGWDAAGVVTILVSAAVATIASSGALAPPRTDDVEHPYAL